MYRPHPHSPLSLCNCLPVLCVLSMRVQVVDVGGGTGFCTLGIVKSVEGKNVTLIDQSPHQLAKAKAKPALKDVTIMEVRRGLWGCGCFVCVCGGGVCWCQCGSQNGWCRERL